MDKKERHFILEMFGWFGVGAVLIAYVLVSLEYLLPTSLAYLLLNISGSMGIVISAWDNRDYQPIILNVIWALVAILGIMRLFVW